MLPSDAFDHASVGELRTALLNTSLLREPRWSDAVRGDPISAVGIAARLLPVKSVTPLIDMVMSALCLNALRGNGGCVLVLSHVLNALGRHNPEFKKMGISWLARDLASRLSRGERSRDAVRCPAAKERP
jgi:hypothetical protein